MSIVNMYSFDQMPDRPGITRQHMVLEGFDLLDPYVSVAQWNIVRINGRAWMQAWHLYYAQSYSGVARYADLISNRTLAEVFGNPATLKLGVIGFRLLVDQSYVQRFITDREAGTICSVVSVDMMPALSKALTVGEHFVEIEFDFVTNTVRTYLNATLIDTLTPGNVLTGDDTLLLGLRVVDAQINPTIFPLAFTDIYITHDNNNGEVSGRLGPVKVLPLAVDEINRPANWGFTDPDASATYPDYDIGEGVTATYTGNLLIPRLIDSADVAGQFKFVSTPAMAPSGPFFNPEVGQVIAQLIGTVNAVATHLFTFTRPKKATAYVIGSYIAAYGAFDNWTFEGSADGQAWTVLDTRTGLAGKFMAANGRVYAFKIPPAKQASYRFYRLVVTKTVFGGSSATFVYLKHMQVLGDPVDAVSNTMMDAVNRTPNSAASDLDNPVIRTGIDSSEGTFGFAVPEFGTAQVLAVKVGITGRRDQASSEHIRAKLKVGATAGPEKVFELKSHTERHEMFPVVGAAPDGTPWNKASLESLQVVVKSKSGAK